MKLPNGDQAVVELIKLREYCLNTDHPRGRHKARVFAAAPGLTADHAEVLRATLLEVARGADAIAGDRDQYGQRYIIDFTMTHGERAAAVRSVWIIRSGEGFPRLVSCYVV